MCSLGRAPRPFPTTPPSPAGGCGARCCVAIRPSLNGPKSTAHEYLSIPLLLCPSDEDTPESISGVSLKLQSLIDECLYKRPEARPRPQNLLARLNASDGAPSEAASRLQLANAIAVKRRANVARLESVARSEAERRLELCDAPDQSLEHLVRLLNDQI